MAERKMLAQKSTGVSQSIKRKQQEGDKINLELTGIQGKMWHFHYDWLYDVLFDDRYYSRLADEDCQKNLGLIHKNWFDEVLSISNANSENATTFEFKLFQI